MTGLSSDAFGAEVMREQLENDYKRMRRRAKRLLGRDEYAKAAEKLERAAEYADELCEYDTRPSASETWAERREKNRTLVSRLRDPDRSRPETDEQLPGGTDDEADGSLDPSQFDLETTPETEFNDIGGMGDLKQELLDKIADPVERKTLYDEYGLEMTHGVLLQGPPGTGKTALSRALAGELGWQFAEIQASNVASSLVGQAAQNISALFDAARENQPCLLFFDEIDAIAMDRGGETQRTQSEEMMTSTLLTEMSKLDDEEIVVVGATNQPEKLDSALLRPGRFTEVIEVDLPDADARGSILRVHLREPPVVNDGIDYEAFAEATEGFSAADIEEVANAAARRAIDESGESLQPITQRHLNEAITELRETKRAKDEGGEYL